MEIRTLESILSDLRRLARIYYPEFDTGEGAVLNDLLFRIHAYAGQLFLAEMSKILAQMMVSELEGSALDEEARKYGLERKPGLKAKGKVVFYAYAPPPPAGVRIPAGTRVSTRFGVGQYSFVTTRDEILMPGDYVMDRRRYEVEVPIEAVEGGRDYNVGVGMIRTIDIPVAGIDGVVNFEPVVGGTDAEDDVEFRDRLLRRILGRNFGSVITYESLIKDNFDVQDVRVLGPGHEFFRLTGPDAVVIFEDTASYSENFVYNQALNPERKFYLQNQPVVEVVRVLVNGEPIEDYVLVKDLGSKRDSVFAEDYVRVTRALNDGDAVSIIYNGSLIGRLQEFLNKDDVRVPALNLWVRLGRRYNVNLRLRVSFKKGFDVVTEHARIREALSLMMLTYDLGEHIDKSDVVSCVQKGFADVVINSVDWVKVEWWEGRSLYDEVLTEENERLIVPFNGYVRLGNIVFL
jgi:hypothetical protein